MPKETSEAIKWALNHDDYFKANYMLVDLVREYFNENNIEYGTFSFKDLKPYLN